MEIVFRDQDSYININNMSKDQSNIYLSGRRVCRYQREVIRIRKSKKDRQHNGQKKKRQKDKQRSTKPTQKKLKIGGGSNFFVSPFSSGRVQNIRDGPFNFQGGGYVFFLKKIF
jgi:hypothetical protein